ncbi:MAG: S8 family peptidase [bacterium]
MTTKKKGLLLLSFILITIIVVGVPKKGAVEVLEQANDSILVKYYNNKVQTIKLKTGEDIEQAIERYQIDPMVEFAEPNYTYRAAVIPNDAYYKNQWYLKRIRADKAWDIKSSSKEVIIAVIDSGVQVTHPDLKDNIWINKGEIPNNGIDDENNGYVDDYQGFDFVNRLPDPSPKFSFGFTEDGVSHGTLIAGILAASGNNKKGITGLSWKAQIMALKALDDKGETDASKVIEAINYAANHKADIINLSFVGFNYSQGVQMAIRRAYDAGVIIVAAGGNDKSRGFGYFLDKSPMYPVCHDDPNGDNLVIGVAATGPFDKKLFFSSYGKCIDITAPGTSIYSTVPYTNRSNISGQLFNKFYDGYWSGTSFAVPMVSGTLALMQQANSNLNPRQLVNILLETADNIDEANPQFSGQLGKGRLNVENAVSRALTELDKISISLMFAPQSNSEARVDLLTQSGDVSQGFVAYENGSGLNLASGDVNNDKITEIVTGPIAGHKPEVKIFDQQGKLIHSFLAYAEHFTGGVQVAVGDVNNDGVDEIITGPGAGHKPEVKIFDQNGKLLNKFLSYAGGFGGGVNVTVGDVNGNGIDEIITGPFSKGGAHIRIFNFDGRVLHEFFAYEKHIRNGFQAAAAHFSDFRDNKAKIIVSAGYGMAPYVKIFDLEGKLRWKFGAYKVSFAGGVNLITGDVNNDGVDEIITGAGPGGSPHVRIFKNYGILVDSFYAGSEKFIGGIKPSIITYNN